MSDARFAESFVRVRSERGQGPLRIRAELRERGVTDVLVDEVLTDHGGVLAERARNRARANVSVTWRRRRATTGIVRPASWRNVAIPSDLIYRVLGDGTGTTVPPTDFLRKSVRCPESHGSCILAPLFWLRDRSPR